MEWRALLATVSWTSVVGLAIARTLAGAEDLTVWAFLVAQVAMVLTVWLVVERVVARAAAEVIQELRALDDQMADGVARRLASAVREDNVASLR